MNDNKVVTKTAYDFIAKQYYEEYKDDTTDLIYLDNFLNGRTKILDLGCGMGHYSRYMKNKGCAVCGVDFSDGMLAIAKREDAKIPFFKGDICNLPDDLDRDFDGVLLAYVVQHMEKDETRAMLVSLHKYITKDCRLLILFREGEGVSKEKEPFNPKFEYTIKSYTVDEMSDLIGECGYRVLRVLSKPPTNDEFCLCPTTKVMFLQNDK